LEKEKKAPKKKKKASKKKKKAPKKKKKKVQKSKSLPQEVREEEKEEKEKEEEEEEEEEKEEEEPSSLLSKDSENTILTEAFDEVSSEDYQKLKSVFESRVLRTLGSTGAGSENEGGTDGMMTFPYILKMMRIIKEKCLPLIESPNPIFVDMGSGVGRVTSAVAFFFNMISLGVEISPTRVRFAQTIVQSQLEENLPFMKGKLGTIDGNIQNMMTICPCNIIYGFDVVYDVRTVAKYISLVNSSSAQFWITNRPPNSKEAKQVGAFEYMNIHQIVKMHGSKETKHFYFYQRKPTNYPLHVHDPLTHLLLAVVDPANFQKPQVEENATSRRRNQSIPFNILSVK